MPSQPYGDVVVVLRCCDDKAWVVMWGSHAGAAWYGVALVNSTRYSHVVAQLRVATCVFG
jgi:hypothetical protein